MNYPIMKIYQYGDEYRVKVCFDGCAEEFDCNIRGKDLEKVTKLAEQRKQQIFNSSSHPKLIKTI